MVLIALIALMWASLLLTAAYFVLFTLNKAQDGLKTFGKLVAAVLLIAALAIGATGIYTAVTGQCPMMGAMQKHCKMMCGPMSEMKRGGMGRGMRAADNNMPSMGGMDNKCGVATKPSPVVDQ